MVKPGYKQTEVGEIPEDWDIKELHELIHFKNGKAHEDDIKNDGEYVVVNSKFISTEGDVRKHSDKCYCPTSKENILMVMSDVPNGRAIAKCFFVDEDEKYTVNQRICSLQLIKDNPKFIFYLLNRNSYFLTFDDGVKQTNLRKDDVLSCPIGVPRLVDEQKSIAKALSDVDELIMSLEKLIAKKRDIKTATMQQLLTGKKRLPGFGEGKDTKQTELGEIPEDWDVKSYGEIFLFLTTASNSRDDLNDNGDIFYVHYGDIHTKFDFLINFENGQLPKIESHKLKGAAFIQNGDLIMADASEDYEGIGKSVEVKGLNGKKAISGLHTFLLRDIGNVFASGFRGYLHSIAPVKKSFDRLATGLKVYGLSKNSLKQVLVPVPPFDEQKEIIDVISTMEADVEVLELRLNKTKSIKQGMMQELLTGRTRLLDVAQLSQVA